MMGRFLVIPFLFLLFGPFPFFLELQPPD